MAPQFDAFLSHRRADKPAVEELARRLKHDGIEPWLDKWNLVPGEPWQEAIEEALNRCATCVVFVGTGGLGPWHHEEMRNAIERRVTDPTFRVIPVLLPGAERGDRSRLPGFLTRTTWVEFRKSLDDKDAFHRLKCGIRGIAPGQAPGEAIYEGRCPYKGLKHFDRDQAQFFFGREALTEWLLDAIRPRGDDSNRFLAILGPSGSGKSSLARAGFVPALERGELEGSAAWPIVVLRPGSNPLESLAVALAAHPKLRERLPRVGKLENQLREDERGLHLALRVCLHGQPETRQVLVLVDRFEEIFTLCDHAEGRQRTIDNLLYASLVARGRTVVVLTMRADFYAKCAAYPDLAAALSAHQLLVGSMSDDELRDAIEKPAFLCGCELEAGLVDASLRDIEGQPGALPLLQHTLLELWEGRTGRRMTLEKYRDIGGIEGALERTAEEIFTGFDDAEKEVCRRIFLRLTQPGEGTEGTKRKAPREKLLPAGGDPRFYALQLQMHA